MTVHAEDMPVYTLDQVVVTANREPEKVIDSNADISVVTAKDIEANHYKSVADAVKQVPGVVIATRGSSSQTYFSIRLQSTDRPTSSSWSTACASTRTASWALIRSWAF